MAWRWTRSIAGRKARRLGGRKRSSPRRPRVGNAGRDDVFDLWRARFDRCDGRSRASARGPGRGDQIRAREPRGDDQEARREGPARQRADRRARVRLAPRDCWSGAGSPGFHNVAAPSAGPWTRCYVLPSQIAGPLYGRGYGALLATSLGSCFSQISPPAIVARTELASSESGAAEKAISGPDIAPRDLRCGFGNSARHSLASELTIAGGDIRGFATEQGRHRPNASRGMELEHPSAFRRFDRTPDIHAIDEADERDAERDASREWTKDVAKEPDSLGRIQLGRSYFVLPTSVVDGRVSGSSQVAHPMDLAPGRPDESPARRPR